jgi:hypothetical protein
MWNSSTFFTTLYSGLITATVALNAWLYQRPVSGTYVKIGISLLPLVAVIVLVIGFFDFRRETRAGAEAVATLSKIEEYLGLHNTVEKTRRYYQEDEYLLPKEYIKPASTFKNSMDFVKTRSSLIWLVKNRKNTHLLSVFFLYTTLSIIAVVLMIVILLS